MINMKTMLAFIIELLGSVATKNKRFQDKIEDISVAPHEQTIRYPWKDKTEAC